MGLFDFFKKTPQIPHSALTVWLHRKTFFEMLALVEAQDGKRPMQLVPVNEVFSSTAALLTTEGLRPVRDEELKGLNLPYHQAYARGMESAAVLSEVAQSGSVLVWSSKVAPLIALVGQAMAQRMELKGKPVVLVPTQELALMAGDEDEAGLAQMMELAEKAYAESNDPCSLQAVSWQDPTHHQQADAWLPAGGALRAQYLSGAAKTRRVDARAMHELLMADHAVLAPMAVMPAAQGGHLVASWFREADVILPIVDRVMLIDTDDAPDAKLEVDFELLLEMLPQAFDPIAIAGEESPRFYRMRGACFPTPSERAFLKAAMAHAESHPDAVEREMSESEALAAWDSGMPMLAEAANEERVALRAPDHRIGMVSVDHFGKRMEQRSARDQAMFQTSFMSLAMLHNMVETTDHANAIIETAQQKMEALRETMEAERPMLLSSSMSKRASSDGVEGLPADYAKMLAGMLDPARLYPVVRPPGYDVGTHNNQLGMATAAVNGRAVDVKVFERVTKPFIDGLSLELVTDAGNMMSPLRADLLQGPLVEAAWRSAMLNLRANAVEPLTVVSPGVYGSQWHDEYDASRALLLPELAQRCVVKGVPLVFAPSLSRVWVTGSEDEAGLTTVLDAIDAYFASPAATTPYQFRLMLFGWPWQVQNGQLSKWPLEGHALAARIAALDEKLSKRRADSAQHVRGFAEGAYRGPVTTGQA